MKPTSFAAVLFVLLSFSAVESIEVESISQQFASARENFQRGRYGETIEALETLANLKQEELDPARIAILRSDAHWAQGERSKAEEVLVEAAKNHNSPALHAKLGKLYFDLGRLSDANAAVELALKLEPDQLLARLVRAYLLTESGEIKKADEAFRWFIRYYNQEQPENPESLVIVAQGASQWALWHSSAQILDFCVNTLSVDAVKADKIFWQAHLVSGRLLLQKYNKAQGRPELKAALVINPNAAEVHIELARSAVDEYNWDEVEEESNRALAIHPNAPGALRTLATAKLYFRELDAAEVLLNEAIKVNAVDSETQALLAALRMLQDGWPNPERWKQIIDHLDRIADLKLDDPTRCESVLIDVARRNPKPGEFLSSLAKTIDMFRQHAVAEPLLKRAIELMPQLSQPKCALGQLYMQTGRIDEARVTLDEAIKSDAYHVRVSNMRKVIKVLDDYESITTDHFVVRADSKLDKLLGQYMSEYLEEVYPELTAMFGFEPESRTQIEIYNTAKGLSGHQWFSARMVGLPWVQTIGASTGVIIAMQSPSSMEHPINWARVLKHEFVHVLTLQQTQFNIPHWYTEALAMRSEGYPRPTEWNQLLLERVPKGELKNLDNLSMGFIRAGTQDNWNFAYCQSAIYAEYMVERFGEGSLTKLLDAYRRNLTTNQAVPEVFGVDKDDFEQGYSEYINRIVAGIRKSDEEPVLKPSQIEKQYFKNKADPNLAADYAKLLLLENRRDEARKLAEDVLKKDSSQPIAAAIVGYLLYKEERIDDAGKVLEPAYDVRHPNKAVLDLIMKVRLRQKRSEDVFALCEVGKEFFPYDSGWWKGIAAAARLSGNVKKRREALEQLVQIESNDPAPRKALAELAISEGNFESAFKYAKLALHVDVLDAEVHRTLGEACRGLKDYQRAIREFDAALELKPKDMESQLGLAETYLAMNRIEDARKLINEALKKDEHHERANELLNRIK